VYTRSSLKKQCNQSDGMRCDRSRLFDHLMSEGKVSLAIRLLVKESKGGVLSLDSQVPCGIDSLGNQIQQTTRDILSEKHPSGKSATPAVLLDSTDTPPFKPIVYDCLTGDLMLICVML